MSGDLPFSVVGRRDEVDLEEYKEGDGDPGNKLYEGGIDEDFKDSREVVATYEYPNGNEIDVYGPINETGEDVDPPERAGIYADSPEAVVAVDFDSCTADTSCVTECPTDVFDWVEMEGNPVSEGKPITARIEDCIECYICEDVCPEDAIKVSPY